jgi:hypothetical protein
MFIRDKPILSSERMLHRNYYRKDSVEEKSFVMSRNGLDAKENWLAVNRQSKSNFGFDFDLSWK